MMKPELSILIDALKEIARFSDNENQLGQIMEFRWQAVSGARAALNQTGHDWVDTSRCPQCNEPGTPQTRRNSVFIMVCEETFDCNYEDQWEHIDPEGEEE
jgi:hypothetical protein